MKVKNCLYCGDERLSYVTHRLDNNGILRCARCSIMMVENISDDTEQLYTADYFEKQEGTRSGYTNYLSSPVANLIGKYAFTRLFASNSGRHLDLGCADGSLVEIFISGGFDSHGLEISHDAVNIAQTKGLNVSFSRLASFPDNLPKSNVITAFDLLEHADKPGTVLREVYKNLENDGYFVFSTLCVKRDDPSDYWYNNSLEHYVYYNKENLAFVLTETFGQDHFAFFETEINGIAEFWGFAKKGAVKHEAAIIEQIGKGGFDKQDPDGSYLLSLFYNQLSKFDKSEKIIRHFQSRWRIDKTAQAKFYNNYFQGKFELAVNESKGNRHLISATNSVYWQALSHAEEVLFKLREEGIIRESTDEILSLRNQVFKLRDDLHSLRNSRVIGRIIKFREFIARLLPWLRRLPMRVVRKTKRTVSRVLPEPAKVVFRKSRSLVRRIRRLQKQPQKTYRLVSNQVWGKNRPLVSVVIPYYNRADTIDDTVNSLKKQTLRNFEVIIVDDGSTDEASIQKLKGLEAGSFKIKVIYQQNQGVAAARNTGIAEARGKYIVCLDSDDILEQTYIEKAVLVMEVEPDVSLATTHQQMFGVVNELYKKSAYNAPYLNKDNMVVTAAAFRREAWGVSGGYKSGIGYEDWEFWLNLAEHGFWGKLIPEPLFRYRTSMQSRYVEDKDIHWNNLKKIRSLHPGYRKNVRRLLAEKQNVESVVEPATAMVNLNDRSNFNIESNGRSNVLITIPWMTFGGAETLIYNYCKEIQDRFNIAFVTGLQSEHEWEYKFSEITPHIYHLANLFQSRDLYLEFISSYIDTRDIDVLHIIHNGFTFDMLPELTRRHPGLKIAVTMFNDRVEYFEQSVRFDQYVDAFVSDNQTVATHYKQLLSAGKPVHVIPNGINAYDTFNPELYNRDEERKALDVHEDELAVFFIGRLSEEKNPDVFLAAARQLVINKKMNKLKFFVIGDGPMRHEVEKLLVDIHSKQVVYLGYQSEVARYLSAADIFVLPSSIEGFPLSILEAMAMRVAVIASDVGAVGDVIETGKDGMVVAPGSAKEVVAAIEQLKGDARLMGKLKNNARTKVEKQYSNLVLGNNYNKLYRNLTQ